MRKIMLILAALFAAAALQAQQRADTLVVNRPEVVTVVTSGSVQEITIKGSATDPDYSFTSRVNINPHSVVSIAEGGLDLFSLDILRPRSRDKEKEREELIAARQKPTRLSTENCPRFGFGYTAGMTEPEGYPLSSHLMSDMFLSVVSLELRPFRKVLEFETGIDFGYRSCRLGEGSAFRMDGGSVELYRTGAELRNQKSALRYNYLGVPFYTSILFGRSCKLSAGIEGHLNFYGRIRDKYTDGYGKHSFLTKEVPVRLLSYEYGARIEVNDFGAYVKYNPFPLLADGKGPEFKTLSFGVMLIF